MGSEIRVGPDSESESESDPYDAFKASIPDYAQSIVELIFKCKFTTRK